MNTNRQRIPKGRPGRSADRGSDETGPARDGTQVPGRAGWYWRSQSPQSSPVSCCSEPGCCDAATVVNGFLGWVADYGVVQGVIIGLTFAYLTTVLALNAIARTETKTVNGWSAIPHAGQPGNGLLVRAALQKALPVVNVFEEAEYWTATSDDAGARLSGKHAYRLRLSAGQLPPTDAFWSFTATDTVGYKISTPIGLSSVDSHSGLLKNADDSVDILLQPNQPSGAARNWLATPPGRFKLMLRAYLPGSAIMDGNYEVPPVVEVRS